jgi:hypothetical protein
VEWDYVHLVRRPLIGLLYQPWMTDNDERGAVLGENLPPCHFVHHKSHMIWPGFEPGPPLWNGMALQPTLLYRNPFSKRVIYLHFQCRDYIPSDGRITDELRRLWKETLLPAATEGKWRKTCQDSPCPSRDSNRIPPKYTSTALLPVQPVS